MSPIGPHPSISSPPVPGNIPAMRFYTARVTTSRSKPPYDRSALRPEADTLNRTVRSLFTPPERSFLKPSPLRASFNPLNYRDSNIRTKMAVVRLRRRKWGERDGKWPEVGLAAAARGSDNWPGMPQFCGVPAADRERKKNVPTGQTGGGSGIRTHGTLARTTVFETAPFDRSGIPPRGISIA